jgi:hypothetical protein
LWTRRSNHSRRRSDPWRPSHARRASERAGTRRTRAPGRSGMTREPLRTRRARHSRTSNTSRTSRPTGWTGMTPDYNNRLGHYGSGNADGIAHDANSV